MDLIFDAVFEQREIAKNHIKTVQGIITVSERQILPLVFPSNLELLARRSVFD